MCKNVIFLCVFLLVVSCNRKSDLEAAIEKIDVDVHIDRFDVEFAEATPDDLPALKSDYPFLFPSQYTDSVWIEKMNDSLQKELSSEVKKAFPDLSKLRTALHSLFQHIRYYFPGFTVPRVITLTSEVDYRNKVIWTDSLLFIALDTYLGEDHRFYEGIPAYQAKNFSGEHITSDVAGAFAELHIPGKHDRSLLAAMVRAGKALYVKDLLLPTVPDALKIGYTTDEMQWVMANESEMWRYFVERSLLYNTDSRLKDRFIEAAPFSKFYLDIDNESPGGTGRFIGWKIVRSYMENNDVSLQQMLETPAEDIFRTSGYKPAKA
ncbi:protein involved in gliding motility GldB [Sinomicrobium oceani]|uniref:Protein involved in gliding motility GldB n=1 Tax=Sinomicrobium oceani TaxID=1150368 RepID=A0A1K1RFJ8_9FLAO|nr:protein involved in gliding motility GldB [Sinomicrobium oceani]